MEAGDRNPGYETTNPGYGNPGYETTDENGDEAGEKRKTLSSDYYENWQDEYDQMEVSGMTRRPHSDYENWEDEYDQMG